jgi:hypothetical protein
VYLLGIEGVALMKAFAGEYDREFIHARIAEIRDLLDRAAELGERTDVRPLPPARGARRGAVSTTCSCARSDSQARVERTVVVGSADELFGAQVEGSDDGDGLSPGGNQPLHPNIYSNRM